MSRGSLEKAIPPGAQVLLDTTILVAYFNRAEQVFPAAGHVINFVREGRNPAIISVVTAMEILIRPLRHDPGDAYERLLDFLHRFPNLYPLDVNMDVAEEAASLRATHNLSTPDALIIGTGLVAQVSHLVTNDRAWKKKLDPISHRIGVCYLADHLPFP